jgi:succinyl-CoA synthetase alpha subunit
MSILIDRNTKVIVQGITGREGRFHSEQMLRYGTKVVAGVTPGRGGQTVCGVPVFNTVREAVEETGGNTSVLFVPAMGTEAAAMEAIAAGLPLIVAIAEHVPVADMLRVYHAARYRGRGWWAQTRSASSPPD